MKSFFNNGSSKDLMPELDDVMQLNNTDKNNVVKIKDMILSDKGNWKVIFKKSTNIIYGVGDNFLWKRESVIFKGENNEIYFSNNSNLKKFRFNIIGNNNKIFIGSETALTGVVAISGQGRQLIVGDKTTFHDVAIFIKDGCDVYIGKDCMFSARIEIRTSDGHSILDKSTNKRINRPGNVYIDDHVWLGKEVIVSKGVYIAKNCVVGAKSFVGKSLNDSNCIYAGCPARKVKDNIDWSRKLLPFDD